MRIVMLFDLPDILEGVRAIVPDAEILTLSPAGPLDQLGRVGAVLATPGGSEALRLLLDRQPDIPRVHVLGTGVDDYPVELFHGRLVTCSKGTTVVPIAGRALAVSASACAAQPAHFLEWSAQSQAHGPCVSRQPASLAGR